MLLVADELPPRSELLFVFRILRGFGYSVEGKMAMCRLRKLLIGSMCMSAGAQKTVVHAASPRFVPSKIGGSEATLAAI